MVALAARGGKDVVPTIPATVRMAPGAGCRRPRGRMRDGGRVPAAADVSLRAARPADLPAVAAIYNAGIAERTATFETRPRAPEDLEAWLGRDAAPFVVAEREGRVVGWARAGPYSDRCVYRGVGEHAVYVDPSARGTGSGAGCSRRCARRPRAAASTS